MNLTLIYYLRFPFVFPILPPLMISCGGGRGGDGQILGYIDAVGKMSLFVEVM